MRHPRVIVYEFDGRLAALLRPLAEDHRWSLREPRQVEECLRLLRQGGPAVVVVRIGRDLEQEFGLIESARWGRPDVPVVVVGDAEHARLAALAWDLGASHVHLPPAPYESVAAVVAGLLGVAFLGEVQ
jgi:DNA-binding response OmpR family regulator